MNATNRNLQTAIWLIGIGVLALTGHWWPGILILVGLSMVAGAFTRGSAAELPEPPDPPAPPEPPTPPAPPELPASNADAQQPIYDLSWLPSHCPHCGGNVRTSGLSMLNATTALCPYCGSRLEK